MGDETQISAERRLDPRWALLGCLGFVVAVILTPLGAWKALGSEALLLAFFVGYLGVNLGSLARRWLGLCPLLVVLAVLLGISHPARAGEHAAGFIATILARNGVALVAVLALGLVYSAVTLIQTLRRLGCPALVVSTLHFMNRYSHVLVEERNRMLIASRARSFGRKRSLWARWSMLGNLLGALFLRAMERGERVHTAMVSRGWDGTIRSLADSEQTR